MKRTAPIKTRSTETERQLFRLDFALRGHSAYLQPADLESLIAHVEAASRLLGAPLLRYLSTLPETSDDERRRSRGKSMPTFSR